MKYRCINNFCNFENVTKSEITRFFKSKNLGNMRFPYYFVFTMPETAMWVRPSGHALPRGSIHGVAWGHAGSGMAY